MLTSYQVVLSRSLLCNVCQKTYPYKHRPINTKTLLGTRLFNDVTQRFLISIAFPITSTFRTKRCSLSMVSPVQVKKLGKFSFKNGCHNLKKGQFKGVT